MVTKLKNNLEYIKYIRKKMNENLPEWNEDTADYEGQPNNNFGISFVKNSYKFQLIKDRGLLEFNLYIKGKGVYIDNLYNSILEEIPEQNAKWRLSLCVELIDFYIVFLKKYYDSII